MGRRWNDIPRQRYRVSPVGEEAETWRTLDVGDHLTVADLHDVVAVAFGQHPGRCRNELDELDHLDALKELNEPYEPGYLGSRWRESDVCWCDDRLGGGQGCTLARLRHGIPHLTAYEYDSGQGRRRVECLGPVEDDESLGRYTIVEAVGGQRPPRPQSPWNDPVRARPVHVDAVRRAVRRRFDGITADDGWVWHLSSLMHRMSPDRRQEFEDYLDHLKQPASVPSDAVFDPSAPGECLRPYRWLLTRVGSDGLPLTESGELPEAIRAEAGAQLQGRIDTEPAAVLIEGALRGGLVRRQKRRLIRMAAARDAGEDSLALLRHMASRWLGYRRHGDDPGYDVRALLALELAIGGDPETKPALGRIAYGMDALRWPCYGRGQATEHPTASDLIAADLDFLRSLGLLAPVGQTTRAFARAAFRSS